MRPSSRTRTAGGATAAAVAVTAFAVTVGVRHCVTFHSGHLPGGLRRSIPEGRRGGLACRRRGGSGSRCPARGSPSIQLRTSRPSFSTNLPAMPLSCRTPVRLSAGMNRRSGARNGRRARRPGGRLSTALVRMPRPCTAIRSSQSPAVVVATYWPSAAASGCAQSAGTCGQRLDVGLPPQAVPPADRRSGPARRR